MAIDRHDCVVRPFNRRIKVINVCRFVRGIWSVAGLITAVHSILAVSDYVDKCYVSTRRETTPFAFIIAMANIYQFGTITVIFTTFVRIVKKLRSSPFAESNQNSELQVTRFSYMLLVFFIVSWFPLSSFSIVTLLAGFTSPEVRGIRVLLLAMSNLNYAMNPFIHMNMLRVAKRAEGPEKSRPEEQQNERPGRAGIEEHPERNETQSHNGETTN